MRRKACFWTVLFFLACAWALLPPPAYEMVYILKEAIEKAGTTEADAVVA